MHFGLRLIRINSKIWCVHLEDKINAHIRFIPDLFSLMNDAWNQSGHQKNVQIHTLFFHCLRILFVSDVAIWEGKALASNKGEFLLVISMDRKSSIFGVCWCLTVKCSIQSVVNKHCSPSLFTLTALPAVSVYSYRMRAGIRGVGVWNISLQPWPNETHNAAFLIFQLCLRQCVKFIHFIFQSIFHSSFQSR